MPRVGYSNHAVDDTTGAVVASAAIELRRVADDSLATLYTAATGATTKSNPFNAEANGSFKFFVDQDRYELTVGTGASATTVPLDLVDARSVRTFKTRADFVTAVSGGFDAEDGAIAFAGGVSYVASSGVTTISDLAGWVPYGDVYPDHFAENVTPGTTDMTAAIQAMHDAYGYLRFRPETYLVTDTIDLTSLDIKGEGPASRVLLNKSDRALFSINTDGATYMRPEVRDIRLSCSSTSTDVNSCAILFTGDESLVQRGTIRDTHCDAFYSFIKSTKDTRTTGFGEEGAVNHMTFENNHVSNVFYGYWFTSGSGTGNAWNGNKSSVRNGGSVFRFGGSGDVVGDIVILGAFPNSPSSGAGTFFTLDAGTIYNANITITGCQMDGNIDTVFDVPAATLMRGVTYIANNTGGSAVLGLPITRDAIVHDDRSTEWTLGGLDSTGTASGTLDIARIKIDSLSAVQVSVSVSGNLNGVGSCQTSAEFLVSEDSGSLSIARIEQDQLKSTCPEISITQHSATEADIEVDYSGSGSGSALITNVSVTGGEFSMERL
jgi:hypothetical protein